MKENIGELICQYRQNRKMTQEEFAFRLGVTPQAVSKWERGNGLPDISLVKGICQILDISANSLLGIAASEVVENDNAAMEQEIKNNMFAEPFLLELGEGLIDYVKAGLETGYINQQRKRLAESTGILMPVLRIKDNLELEKNTYRILSYDKVLYEEKLNEGDEDAYRKMIDNVSAKCQENYADILNKQIVKIMIDNIKEFFPGAVVGLIPEKIGYLQVQRKLQEMLRQGKSIRDMLHILEELEEAL
ncbi:MAG: helix-turn-helix domain-containing protein [Lachnospiraceae bacterium]|nr:helix-turn-helix domain-containing protein [Lachnospiraceae bacterium]